jgi:hypothetical protein
VNQPIVASRTAESSNQSCQVKNRSHFCIKLKMLPLLANRPGLCCYFMDRFILTWKLVDKMDSNTVSDSVDYDMDLSGEAKNFWCSSCVVGRDQALEVRHKIEFDWLYLAELSKYSPSENLTKYEVKSANGNTKMMEKTAPYLHYASV